MNRKEKRTLIGIIVVFVILIVGLIIWRGSIKEKEVNTKPEENKVNTEKYVEIKEDGTKVNKSNKLQETKKLGNLEISNIGLSSKGNESYLQATVKNTGTSKAGDEFIHITVVDDGGNTLTEVDVYLNTIDAGQETILSSKTSSDFANAYDFSVSK